MRKVFILTLLAACLQPLTLEAQQEKPNIAIMMVDNLGWGELGIYGGGVLRGTETPRLDKLAEEGLRFLNFNVEPRRQIDEELTEKAIAFMGESVESDQPFFTFVPFTHAHLPTLAHPESNGKTGNGPFANVLAEIDHRRGQILDAIDDLGVRDNTVVLWVSDNGPEEIEGYHGTAGYWRGNYFTALEGSLRVPAIIRWPGRIPAGWVSNEIVHITDILPTLSKIAGYQVPSDRIIDGVDQLDFLIRQDGEIESGGIPCI